VYLPVQVQVFASPCFVLLGTPALIVVFSVVYISPWPFSALHAPISFKIQHETQFTCISTPFFLTYIKPRVLELFAQPTPSAHLVLSLTALTFMCVNSLTHLLKNIFSCARDLPLPLSRLSFKRAHRKIQILINFIKYCRRKQ